MRWDVFSIKKTKSINLKFNLLSHEIKNLVHFIFYFPSSFLRNFKGNLCLRKLKTYLNQNFYQENSSLLILKIKSAETRLF